jgi:hypothetical protein
MRWIFNRALVFGAGLAVILAASLAMPALADGTAPAPRLVGSYALDLPVLLPEATTGPQDLRQLVFPEFGSELPLFDGLGLYSGYHVDVARVLDRYAPTAGGYDGLFYSLPSSPYAALSSGGSYVGADYTPASWLHVNLGLASTAPGLDPYLLDPRVAVASMGSGLPYDARHTSALIAGLAWNFAKWGNVGFTASQTNERDGALGAASTAVDAARTNALGFSANMGLGGGWMTSASYSEGFTQLDLKPGATTAGSALHSQAYGFAVAKHGLFGNDALGIAFSHPAPGYGEDTLSGPGAQLPQFLSRDKLFAGGNFSNAAEENDFELGYVTSFGSSLALQANAAYQQNYGGQNGANAVSLLSRAKIKF